MFWSDSRVLQRKKSAWELLLFACVLSAIVWIVRGRQQAIPAPIPLPPPIQVPEVQEDNPVPVTSPKQLWCKEYDGVNDFVVSVKTSAAEVANRLPMLLESSFQCPQNLMVFSDWSETIKGQHVVDALDDVEPRIQASHPDFDLWRRLRKGGPDVLADEEMWEADSTAQAIDKWKMLPMMNKTFHEHGQTKKWFVFTDTHTFMFYHNLATWLHQLNSTQAHYIGIAEPSETISPDHHGRSFILSNPALQAIVKEYNSNPSAWHDFIGQHKSAGVVVRHIVAKARLAAFHDPDMENSVMIQGWPIIQPQSPATIDYRAMYMFKRLWCFPSISYEHLSPAEIKEMYKFEEDWVANHQFTSITHADVLKDYILPRLIIRGGRADDWDNFSGEGMGNLADKKEDSVSDCQTVCQNDESCVQYSYGQDGVCRYAVAPRMGTWRKGEGSRWLLARMQDWVAARPNCTQNEGWFTV